MMSMLKSVEKNLGKGKVMWRNGWPGALAILVLLAGCGSKEPTPAYKNRDAQYQQKQAAKAVESLDRDFSDESKK